MQFYASRFAAKEAVFKSLHIDSDSFQLTDIEIIATEFGGRAVQLSGQIQEIASRKEISKIELSVSHEKDYVIAFAIAQA